MYELAPTLDARFGDEPPLQALGEPLFDPWIIAAIAAAGISLLAFRAWQRHRGS